MGENSHRIDHGKGAQSFRNNTDRINNWGDKKPENEDICYKVLEIPEVDIKGGKEKDKALSEEELDQNYDGKDNN